MPKQKRWALKRKCDRCMNSLEKGLCHMTDLAEAFNSHYPDVAAMIVQLYDTVRIVKAAIKTMRDDI